MTTARKAGDFIAAANRYVAGVLDGSIPAARSLILACERQQRDLARQSDPKWPYRFDVRAAEKICFLAELLPHVKGEWAERHELIRLGDWQCFFFTTLFGWLWKSDPKKRRFREVYAEVPRKNGKSMMGAIIGDYMWAFDGEAGAEVYSGATTEKQAWEVFRPARLMVSRSPDLVAELGGKYDDIIKAKSLVVPADLSRFEPMIGNPGDGSSPSCAIADEYHEHDTSRQVDSMKTGMLARKRPILAMITTAGVNLAGPCYDKRGTCLKVLDGSFDNEELFILIYTIDDEDDWTDPKVLAKANPNLGVSVDADALAADQRQAVLNPIDQNRFRTKHLNVWCSAKVAWMPLAVWDACADPGLDFADFAAVRAWLGLDLASRDDLACYGRLFRRDLKGVTHYWFFPKFYLPEEALEVPGPNQAAYRKWKAQGHIVTTDGAELDFERIEHDLDADMKVLQHVVELDFDPWRATYLAQRAAAKGLLTVEVKQTTQFLSLPMKEVLAAAKSGRLHHDGNPVLRWMMGNVVAREDPNGNIFPRKEKPHMKIDGPVTLITTMSRAMTGEETAGIDGWLKSKAVTA